MVRALDSPDRACCVVTAGERGCWYAERDGEVHHFPAYQVEVVDTTGCGDVFHGAYAASIARGEPVPTAIRIATATAGLKATQPGGRSGIPTRAAVEAFLKAQAA
jgi:sulfofructose kinase